MDLDQILGAPHITADVKAFLERMYCYELFDKDDRSVWMPMFEADSMKYAAVIAICEQNDAADMGFTAEAMKMPLEALGYRVVETVKVLHLFEKNEAKENVTAISQAKRAGEKLAKTMLLREQVRSNLSK